MNAIEILLGIGVIIAWLSALGVLVMRDPYERLHYMAPLSTLAVMSVAAAVMLEGSFFESGIKALLVVFILLLTNPVLTHATARSARIHQFGHWVIQPDEKTRVVREQDSGEEVET